MKIIKNDCTLVAKAISKELIDDITGENEKYLFGKDPSDSVMIGMIDGATLEDSILLDEIVDNTKIKTIPSIGLRFTIDNNTKKISIGLKGKLFYRVKPSFEEQISYLLKTYSGICGRELKNEGELIKFVNDSKDDNSLTFKDELVRVNKSIDLSSFGMFEINIEDFQNEIEKVNKLISNKINSISSVVKESVAIKEVHFPTLSYLDKETFNERLNSNTTCAVPNWNIQISGEKYIREDSVEILLQLVNYTNKIAVKGSYATAIFNGGLCVNSEYGFEPYLFNTYKYSYAENPTLDALGNNCSVKKINDFTIETENIPIFYENRTVTVDKFNDFITFRKLIENPIENLKVIYEKMKDKLAAYNNQLSICKKTQSKEYCDDFEKEINDFSFEIKRFKHGIELLQNKADVALAFKLLNETFDKNRTIGKKDYYVGWRMFQIAFIVSEIADMVNCEYEGTPGFECNDINNVDLIFFPTGGGKTEAFLGCVIFCAFFDRIRGKNSGVTSIIKYPLRLLAAQQLDRVLLLTIYSNIVKKENQIGGEDFSVGFYTGSGNTPNRMTDEKLREFEHLSQESKNAMYRQIDRCPICGSEMNIEFDNESYCLKHKCSDEKCLFEPPIFIIDDEIYRFRPTFIISTIDKMASFGFSLGFKSLFGQCAFKCEKHGYNYFSNKCGVTGCQLKSISIEDIKDPAPTLIIQDELHLINESLGTFDSHYESAIQYYSENLLPNEHKKKIKFIGATATISNYQNHIRNLYNKNAKKFPSSIKNENFYSIVDLNDVSRIIIGAALYGGSITNNVQKMTTLMRLIVTDWIRNSETKIGQLKKEGFSGNENDLKEILNYYIISIVYNNSKNDAGDLFLGFENIGNNTLLANSIKKYNIAEITGDVEFKEVKSVIHDVESTQDKYDCKNLIIATSAISHGVDEDSFNQIYFFGMPNQTSEYIQAYSRSGRKITGLVFDIFRIVRDRDKSFLKNFYNYHKYKDILINPVPINRYAKNAIFSTLPGIISGLLLQKYVQSNYAKDVTRAINAGTLTFDMLLNDLRQIYDCDNQNSKIYEEAISDELKNIFVCFQSNKRTDINIRDFIEISNQRHKGPMINLRDIDVALEVKMR